MKISISIILAVLISGTVLYAQNEEFSFDSRPKNNIYLSTVGADLTIVSMNYERLFWIRPKSFWSVEIGVGYNKQVDITEPGPKPDYLVFPQHITMNLGKKRKFFEFGIGATLFFGDDLPENSLGESAYYDIYPLFGYRLHPIKSKKVNFRVFASFPPSFVTSEWENWVFWWSPVGVSMGIGF